MRKCTPRFNLIGQRAGTLIAKEYIGNSQWRCICDVCENEVIVTTDWFHKIDRLRRDGCKHVKPVTIGARDGYLTVVKQADDYIKPKSGRHERQWLCRCTCGREKVIYEDNLKSNKSMTCGLCSTRVSIPEKAILFYLRKTFNEVVENYRPAFLYGKEIDIYVPKIRLGIEYDGERWHPEIGKDLEKDNICKTNGIRIIRIREPKAPIVDDAIITPKPIMNGNHMTGPIKELFKIIERDYGISDDIDVDCRRDNADICRTLINSDEDKSLAKLYPEIAKEWDYEKNYPLTPDKVSAHAGKKAYWICLRGHKYSSVIASRTGNRPCGCPVCSGRGSATYRDGNYIGEHSLAKERPDIAVEFIEEKNGISANNIAVSSNKKMWFRCSKCSHEWLSKVNNRTSSNNQGCPVCGRQKARRGRCRQVICVETGTIYESITDANRKTGITNITACCKGRIKKAGGYHWNYID